MINEYFEVVFIVQTEDRIHKKKLAPLKHRETLVKRAGDLLQDPWGVVVLELIIKIC